MPQTPHHYLQEALAFEILADVLIRRVEMLPCEKVGTPRSIGPKSGTVQVAVGNHSAVGPIVPS